MFGCTTVAKHSLCELFGAFADCKTPEIYRPWREGSYTAIHGPIATVLWQAKWQLNVQSHDAGHRSYGSIRLLQKQTG
jgi:hypothetical protein